METCFCETENIAEDLSLVNDSPTLVEKLPNGT